MQEVDHFLPRSNSVNQVQEIAKAMKAVDWAFAPAIIGTPGEKWRALKDTDESIITAKSKGEGGYGIGFASTIPVTAYERIELGRSPVGMPLLVPGGEDGKGKPRFIYVQDEPRVALVAHLENGWSIINTHLSFVPGFSLAQLIKIKRWANTLGVTDKSKILIMGDLNLPFSIFVRDFKWRSLAAMRTFPSWYPKVQIDYFLSQKLTSKDVRHIQYPHSGMSDHLPLQIEVD